MKTWFSIIRSFAFYSSNQKNFFWQHNNNMLLFYLPVSLLKSSFLYSMHPIDKRKFSISFLCFLQSSLFIYKTCCRFCKQHEVHFISEYLSTSDITFAYGFNRIAKVFFRHLNKNYQTIFHCLFYSYLIFSFVCILSSKPTILHL